jgi:hypothetical protein
MTIASLQPCGGLDHEQAPDGEDPVLDDIPHAYAQTGAKVLDALGYGKGAKTPGPPAVRNNIGS